MRVILPRLPDFRSSRHPIATPELRNCVPTWMTAPESLRPWRPCRRDSVRRSHSPSASRRRCVCLPSPRPRAASRASGPGTRSTRRRRPSGRAVRGRTGTASGGAEPLLRLRRRLLARDASRDRRRRRPRRSRPASAWHRVHFRPDAAAAAADDADADSVVGAEAAPLRGSTPRGMTSDTAPAAVTALESPCVSVPRVLMDDSSSNRSALLPSGSGGPDGTLAALRPRRTTPGVCPGTPHWVDGVS